LVAMRGFVFMVLTGLLPERLIFWANTPPFFQMEGGLT